VRVLCACGAQLSASSATTPLAEPRSQGLEQRARSGNGASEAAAAGGDALPLGGSSGGSPEGEGLPVEGLSGVLWKRASKVHIAQRTAEEASGQERDWVTRHFSLLPRDGLMVYKQNASDDLATVRGVVPLASFDSVETTQGPNDNLPYAFRLTARGGDMDSSFVFAAPSQRERDAWISGLAAAVAEENAAVAPRYWTAALEIWPFANLVVS